MVKFGGTDTFNPNKSMQRKTNRGVLSVQESNLIDSGDKAFEFAEKSQDSTESCEK